ncbi:hypothetical protein MCHI_002430 [Candidatus Magnetoovum chiemensis]|nr:hypothetical protein MCHI_002430 [Candidatus Magnetoovum chiemensis]
MAKNTINYNDILLESLKDPDEAALYLNAALEEESKEALGIALRNVVNAVRFSNASAKSICNIEDVLLEDGNVKIIGFSELLRNLGLKLAVEVNKSV